MRSIILFFCSVIFFLTPCLLFGQVQAKNKVNLADPCCTILSVGPVDGLTSNDPAGPVDAIVFVRNNTTGRTFMFNADALDKNTLHVGDAINADMTANKITAINGAVKSYPIKQPNPAEPCCGISNLIPGEPCCGIVSVQNNGITYSFSVPKNISSITASSIVNTEIKCKFEFMMIQQNSSGTQVNDKKNMNEETLSSSAEQMWDIQMDSGLTGATGQLVLQMPTNISYAHLKVFKSGDTKVAASLFGNGKSKLLPGNYNLMMEKYSIKNVPIEVGKTTRLKTGILNYSPRGPVRIVDSNKQEFSMAGPFKIALPPGTYYIDGKKDHAFVIKDGEVTEY